MVALQVSIERYARESMREVQGSNPCGAKKFMRWNGLLAGFEARSRRVRFPLGAPSFASVDVEKVEPRKLDEDKARPLESKYQLSLRTSNLPGLVSTGKMTANEGGAVTCKFISE